VVVIGVNFQDTADAARAYVRTDAVTYPVVEDAGSKTALAYGLRGVPETFVVNPAGRIVKHVIGPVHAAGLAAEINSVLGTGAR
jgi:cytochrome c biogenesis protein CcmG, thiol:disulfide interchange protein DsbE